jgi:hypothetical protein
MNKTIALACLAMLITGFALVARLRGAGAWRRSRPEGRAAHPLNHGIHGSNSP